MLTLSRFAVANHLIVSIISAYCRKTLYGGRFIISDYVESLRNEVKLLRKKESQLKYRITLGLKFYIRFFKGLAKSEKFKS